MQRKMPPLSQNPEGRVLIQLQPFTLLTHDFSGRYSLKLLHKKNLMSCSKAKGLFLLLIGEEASSLSLLSFFKGVKSRGNEEKTKGCGVRRDVIKYLEICSRYHF